MSSKIKKVVDDFLKKKAQANPGDPGGRNSTKISLLSSFNAIKKFSSLNDKFISHLTKYPIISDEEYKEMFNELKSLNNQISAQLDNISKVSPDIANGVKK